MKKWMAWVMVLLMAMPYALAELAEGETEEMMDAVAETISNAAINYIVEKRIDSFSDEELQFLSNLAVEEQKKRGMETPIEILQPGSKGEAVQKLQVRLIELNYLSGSADGDYGNKTRAAVEKFQKAAGLSVTGIADEGTQKALFDDNAPVSKEYLKLDYDAISRDPDAYEGKNYTFYGKVLQVMEQDLGFSTYTVMRIGTGGSYYYDDVVYVIYYRPDGEKRILEDDRVTVYGECEGLYTYETVLGAEVTIPQFEADTIEVK